jgi:hypothetical protein
MPSIGDEWAFWNLKNFWGWLLKNYFILSIKWLGRLKLKRDIVCNEFDLVIYDGAQKKMAEWSRRVKQ